MNFKTFQEKQTSKHYLYLHNIHLFYRTNRMPIGATAVVSVAVDDIVEAEVPCAVAVAVVVQRGTPVVATDTIVAERSAVAGARCRQEDAVTIGPCDFIAIYTFVLIPFPSTHCGQLVKFQLGGHTP